MALRTPGNGFSRRSFLQTGMASAVVLGSGLWTAGSVTARDKIEAAAGSARNVIILVSDGMSTGTLTLADIMLKRRDGRSSNWMKLYERGDVRRGLMDMASLDSIVTCSAAASTSWGSGFRVNSGSVNWGPDNEQYIPILKLFRDAGKSTGLVTTTRITHATPAGFGANVESRNFEFEIAEQYLERRYDILMGGGISRFNQSSRPDGRDLFADYAFAGYEIVRSKKELFSVPGGKRKILGTFHGDHLPYTLDHINTPEYRENIPTLAEMLQIALNRLSQNRKGFIIQVEGGRVDHAGHGNDIGGLIYDQIAFDDAVGVAVDFAGENRDTLVIVTTDHGVANPGITRPNPNRNIDLIKEFRHTNDWILSEVDDKSTVGYIQDRVEEATKLKIMKEEAHFILKATQSDYVAPYRMMSKNDAVLGQVLANYTSVGWTGTDHTGDYVELAAFGPGSEAIGPFTRNTDLFRVMTQAAGVEVPARG